MQAALAHYIALNRNCSTALLGQPPEQQAGTGRATYLIKRLQKAANHAGNQVLANLCWHLSMHISQRCHMAQAGAAVHHSPSKAEACFTAFSFTAHIGFRAF